MVALRKQPVPLAFTGGVETKTDPKSVPPVKLLDLQNATFIKQTSLAKRNGYKAYGNTVEGTLAALIAPKGIGVRGTELVKFDNAQAYSYLPNTDRWSLAGDATSVTASSDPIARTGAYQQMPDVATNNGVTVVAWEDNLGGVWYSVLEALSKRVILPPTNIVAANAQKPRCLAVGEVLHVLYAVPTSSAIYVLIVNPALPTVVNVPQVLVSELSSTTPLYDACTTTYNTDKPGLIVFVTPLGGGFTYKLGYISPAGILGSALTSLPSVIAGTDPASRTIACAWSTTSVAVMGAANSGPFYEYYSTALASTGSGSVTGIFAAGARRLAIVFAGSLLWWALDIGVSDDDTNLVKTGSIDPTGAQLTNQAILGHGLVSRAWSYGGNAYVTIARPLKFFSYAATIKLKSGGSGAGYDSTVLGRFLPSGSPGLPARTHLSSVVNNGDGTFGLPLLYRIQLSSSTGDKFSEIGIRLYTLNFANPSAFQSVQFGRGLYIAGACMQHYDGDRVAEADFHCAPDTAAGGLPAVTQAGGGALTTAVSYGWKVIYEEIDGQGEIHRGPVSVAKVVAMTGGNTSVTLTIPTYPLTAKRRVRIGVFRAPANQTASPTLGEESIPYYRVSSTDPTASGPNGYVVNDPTTSTVTFVDNMSDAVLTTEEPLYTNGGVLSNDPPDFGGGTIAVGANRLFWPAPDDPTVIYFSKQRSDETATELVKALSFQLDPYGGPVVAIGVMDGAVFAFKQTAIYGMVGSGPDDAGSVVNTSFSPPALVTSDVGCKSPGSICQTPIGITFQSSKGIMVLGRDRSVVDIGADVYAYNSQTIVSATLLPDRHQILFLTNAGRSLLYDYEKKQWSTYTNHEGLGAVVLAGVYHYLRNDGRVFAETPGVYKDDNSHIPMVIETAWIKFTGFLQGWQRVLDVTFLGKWISSHTLRARYRIDYEDSYSPPFDMPVDIAHSSSLYGGGVYGTGAYGGAAQNYGAVYQEKLDLNQRCQAISFRIEDVEGATAFGAAFELSELLIVGGVLGPQFTVGASRQG